MAATYSNAISILPGNGSFGLLTSFNVPALPFALTVSDFNSDRKTDIAVADTFGVTILTNTAH